MADDGDTATRLREAAIELFGRHGVQGTSTREILSAAGLKNPSAISYHFGSKAGLVEDLVAELRDDAWPVVRLQVELAASGAPPVRQWAEVASKTAAALVATRRGCLLARILWEYDGVIAPNAFEEFLGSGDPLAEAWQDAVELTFPDLPRVVAIARNFLTVHTTEWLLARYASRILGGRPERAITIKDPEELELALFEISMALFTAPSGFTNESIVFE